MHFRSTRLAGGSAESGVQTANLPRNDRVLSIGQISPRPEFTGVTVIFLAQ